MASLLPRAVTAMGAAFTHSWTFNASTTDAGPGEDRRVRETSENDSKYMPNSPLVSTTISNDASRLAEDDQLTNTGDNASWSSSTGEMPSVNLEFRDDNESDDGNDISAVIRKHQRTCPKTRQPSVPTSVLSGKTLAISSETPFTRAISQIGKSWSSFIVGNFLPETKREDAPDISTTNSTATPLLEVHCKSTVHPLDSDGPIHGDSRISTGNTKSHKRPLLTEGDIEAPTSSPPEPSTKRRMVDRHHDRASGSRRHRSSPEKASFDAPSGVLSRETYKAIKHTPITAEAKARERLQDIKNGKGKSFTSLSAANTDHDELFKVFAARQTPQQRTQFATGLLLGPERQREASTHSYHPQINRNINPKQRKGSKPVARSSRPELEVGSPRAELPTRPPPKKPTERAPKTRTEPPQSSPPPEPLCASSPTTTQTIPAQDFLENERLVSQWVVYRTPRFCLSKFSKHEKKIRCTTHISKQAANEVALARHDRIRKGWIRKSMSYEKGLFEGIVEYASDGDGEKGTEVVHFWVEEETKDLANITAQWRKPSKTLHLDQAKAGIYARKRYDVWSVMIYPAERDQGRNQGQTLVMDCANDDDEDNDTSDLLEEATDDSSRTEHDEASGASPGNSTDTSQTFLGDSFSGSPPPATTTASPSSPSSPSSAPPSSHPRPSNPKIDPFTYISVPKSRLHGSYATPRAANEAAMAVILDLAKPRNARIEDNHYYKHHLVPDLTEQFWRAQAQNGGLDVPVSIQWDTTDVEGCKWEFLHLEVQVVESELEGVVDLGGIAVDGGPPPPDERRPSGVEQAVVDHGLAPAVDIEDEEAEEVSEAE